MTISKVSRFAFVRTEARCVGILRTILVPLIEDEDGVLDFRTRFVQFDNEPPTLRLGLAFSAYSAEIFHRGSLLPDELYCCAHAIPSLQRKSVISGPVQRSSPTYAGNTNLVRIRFPVFGLITLDA